MSVYERMKNRLRGQRHPTIDDQLNSVSLRDSYRLRGVDIGLYSYGCFDINRIPAGVTIGRYCSFSATSAAFLRNHGVGFVGMTPYFYNASLGAVDLDTIGSSKCTIGDDVWVGHNAVVLPGVGTIGRGAVIAAGAVVTGPVPAYAIVAGNPARVIRMRFDEPTIAAVEETKWWMLDPPALRKLAQEQPDLVFSPALHFKG